MAIIACQDHFSHSARLAILNLVCGEPACAGAASEVYGGREPCVACDLAAVARGSPHALKAIYRMARACMASLDVPASS